MNGLVDEAEEKGETGQEGRHQSEVFYADDGMVVLSDPAWLQGAFNSLVAIFDRVGLLTNIGKTVSMVCHPCWGGGRKPDRGSIQSEYNRGGKILCIEATGKSGVREVWGGNRGCIHVESSDDSA